MGLKDVRIVVELVHLVGDASESGWVFDNVGDEQCQHNLLLLPTHSTAPWLLAKRSSITPSTSISQRSFSITHLAFSTPTHTAGHKEAAYEVPNLLQAL